MIAEPNDPNPSPSKKWLQKADRKGKKCSTWAVETIVMYTLNKYDLTMSSSTQAIK
jgi:hypothetical protein